MPIMTTGGNDTAYTGDMDQAATSEQVAEVQQLFGNIGLDVRVTASYMAKSAAGDVAEAVLWLGGLGVARAFILGAGNFGKTFGGDLGHYEAKRVTEWLERLRHVRGRNVTVVAQDPSLRVEIILAGDEPLEAFEQLRELLDNDGIKKLPGQAAAIRWRQGEGWVRPF
jgi:hypothetical protein